MVLADFLADLRYAGRLPSWDEYRAASPCDQRAIERRWKAIPWENGRTVEQATVCDRYLKWARTSKMSDEEIARQIGATGGKRVNYDDQVPTGEFVGGERITISRGDMEGE